MFEGLTSRIWIGKNFVSRLSVAECAHRLGNVIDPPMTFFGRRPAVGRANESGFRFAKRISYRNSFQTYASGRFDTVGGETRILCRFGMHPAVLSFGAIWFGFLGITCGVGIIATLHALWFTDPGRPAPSVAALIGAVFPLGMVAFGAALFAFGRWLARNEEEFLVNFLAENLRARLLPGED